MTAPIITWPDLSAIFEQKMNQPSLYAWCADHGVDEDALDQFGLFVSERMNEMIDREIVEKMEAGELPSTREELDEGGVTPEVASEVTSSLSIAYQMLAITCFQMGWDAHFQMRGERPSA